MGSELLSPDPTPLIATLQAEAKKAGVVYDFQDPAFARKLAKLIAQVPREYEVLQAFRAFLQDSLRGCTPFFFPDRFSKYRKATPAAPVSSSGDSLLVTCSICHSDYQRLRPAGCPYCEEHRGSTVAGELPWRRPSPPKNEPGVQKGSPPEADTFVDDELPEVPA